MKDTTTKHDGEKTMKATKTSELYYAIECDSHVEKVHDHATLFTFKSIEDRDEWVSQAGENYYGPGHRNAVAKENLPRIRKAYYLSE